ncbi:MAG: hypothetical protein ACREVJ_10975, partial [Gammaproteobacteria bacterium]
PVLTRLEGLEDRMSSNAKMFGGMLVPGVIEAARSSPIPLREFRQMLCADVAFRPPSPQSPVELHDRNQGIALHWPHAGLSGTAVGCRLT